jgi:hypothetical protein
MRYREVLEHVTPEQGEAYLDRIRAQSPDLLERIGELRENDLVGSPVTHNYPGVGTIGPTTLRYVKVASDLRQLFGALDGFAIAEIGVGYGGQALIIDKLFNVTSYTCYDLPPVLGLVSKYLECHLMNSCYRLTTLNQSDGAAEYDLAISNYAFSELPSHLQVKYIQKVLSRSQRGYLTMNTGKNESTDGNKLSLARLRELLPAFEVLKEDPLTARDNYIIIWGNK